MKKITTVLNSPTKIALFAICCVLIISIIAFAAVQASAGVNANKTLGMDKGVNIALNDAGLRAEDVSDLSAHYDTEDGIPVYEVKFTSGGYEYDYQIKASDGTILEADRDALKQAGTSKTPASGTDKTAKTDPAGTAGTDKITKETSGSAQTKPASDYIGVDKAKSIALNNAGLSASSVTFTKAKLDREDGVRVYEIEFYTSTKEYEYEINAKTGKILDKDVEGFDDEDWDD